MPFGDDDDDLLLPRQRDDRADHGATEELRDRIARKHGAEKAAKVEQTELKSQVNLRQLQKELSGEGDEETKRTKEQEKNAKEKSHAPKTKSQREKEKTGTLTAQDDPDIDTMLERQETEGKVSDEEVQREPG